MPIQQSIKYTLQRKNGIPLYIQLRNQILFAIRSKQLKLGDKMPTERELSNQLEVSRKTVSHTYNILESLNALKSHQGKGTFVEVTSRGAEGILQSLGIHDGQWDAVSEKNAKDNQLQAKQVELNNRIDALIDFALEHKMSQEQLKHVLRERIQYQYNKCMEPYSLFVECNVEQATSFAKELEEVAAIKMQVCTLTELRKASVETHKKIKLALNLVTTFNHLGEIKELLDSQGIMKNVFGVAITPNLESLIRIAKYPKDTKIGLVSLSEEFFFNVQSALNAGGIDHLSIGSTTSNDTKTLNKFLQDLDVVIVSPGRYEEVYQLVNHDKDVISFEYKLDQGSVSVVASKLK